MTVVSDTKTEKGEFTNLFNHVSALDFILFKVLIHIDGEDRHLVQVLELCPVSQRGEPVM